MTINPTVEPLKRQAPPCFTKEQTAQAAAEQAKPKGIKRLLRFLPIKKKGA